MTLALDAVRGGEADGAVVPIENSVEGSVPVTLDELATGEPLMITREMTVPIAFSLLARPASGPTTYAGWRPTRTPPPRPGAGAPCTCPARRSCTPRRPRTRPSCSPSPTPAGTPRSPRRSRASTTGSPRWPTGIGDNPDALTRFVLVSRPGSPPPPTGRDKTSIVAFMRDDHPGALMEILDQLTVRGVNMTRIESRPTGAALGNYCFSIDCEGHVDDARVGEALMGLRRVCADVRFLGSYERHDGIAPDIRVGTSDREFQTTRPLSGSRRLRLARLRHGPRAPT